MARSDNEFGMIALKSENRKQIDAARVKLTHIEGLMKQAELYSAYWNAMALTGAAQNRRILKGGSNGVPMTPEELTAEALETSLRHIQKFNELMDERIGAQKELFELERKYS